MNKKIPNSPGLASAWPRAGKFQIPNLEAMRHSCEHVLTMAMLRIWGNKIKAAMGPATDEGFYFDFEYANERGSKCGLTPINEKDFPKIEKEMTKIIKADLPIIKDEVSVKEARKFFSKNIYKGNQYKHEWLDEIEGRGEKVSVYWMGEKGKDIPETFVDICSGPHVSSTGKIGVFKLTKLAGAYWHGDEKNKMLTRIYGTCFKNQKELDHYLWQIEEAKKRDHRSLGQKLELFMFDDEVGQGLPLWLPKGAFIRHKVMEFAFNTYLSNGYQPVVGPHISSEALWQHSGHLDFYKESMYNSFGIEVEQYRLKPMNCPIHVKMYKFKPRSYKDLPIRWTEMGTVYRYEKSGVLHGLLRVRGFTQDDAHIICTPNQLHQELVAALKLTLYILKSFGFTDFEMNLSTRDPKNKDKFIGTDKGWQLAETELKKALADIGFKDYVLDVGGAVFYGPKIDLKVADSIGRKWQLSTIQVDFNLPGRFKMKYIGHDGQQHEPFMIHRALLGSLERFMGVYIEHTAGVFPVWLSPIQAIIIPIADRHVPFSQSQMLNLKTQNLRVEIDDRAESMQKKIKEAEEQKIPYMLIVGDREVRENKVAVRQRGENNLGSMTIEQFFKKIKEDLEKKR